MRRVRRKQAIWTAVIVVLLIGASVTAYVFRGVWLRYVSPDECTAAVDGKSVTMTVAEAEIAGRITAPASDDSADKVATHLAADAGTGLNRSDADVVAAATAQRAAFTCRLTIDAAEAPDELTESGLVPRAQVVLDDIKSTFGDVPVGGFEPGGVNSGHIEGSAHYEGRAVDLFFRPITEANTRRGWTLAQYLVSQADRLKIRTVIYDARIWTAWRSGQGWRAYDPPSGSGDQLILEHRDHVHVDVYD